MITPVAAWIVFGLAPAAAFFCVVYYLLALPLLRQERARFFFDLLEDGMSKGRSAERTIVAAASSGDASLGLRFHLLAALVRGGGKIGEALEKVPGFLSPQLCAILRVGEEIGEGRRVLVAAKGLLKDAASQTVAGYNYLLALFFVIVPIVPALSTITSIVVLPKLAQVFKDVLEDDSAVPPISPYLGAWNVTLGEVQFVIGICFAVVAALYAGGPRFAAWVEAGFFVRGFDRLFFRIPWKRKRMQRDFSHMLSILLDANLPEERAVRLAGESTANVVFLERSLKAAQRLREGSLLDEALKAVDDSPEFEWRLRNALRGGRNFAHALAGWFEALDAAAYQQEQAVAQVITTGLVIVNGINVATFMLIIFTTINQILQGAILW